MGTYWPWGDPDRYRQDLRHTQIVRNLVPKTIFSILTTLYNYIHRLGSTISLRLSTQLNQSSTSHKTLRTGLPDSC
jgi:hypothetical protein